MAGETAQSPGNGGSLGQGTDPKSRSTRYPRYSLGEAEKLVRATFDLGPRHVQQEEVAQALNFSGVENGAFKGRRAAAKYFGLVEYSGNDFINVSEPWIEVLHSEDSDALVRARQEALLEPDLYRQLFDEYKGRMLPRVERLARDLHLKPIYGIKKVAASDAAQTFLDSAHFAGLVDSKGYLRPVGWRDQDDGDADDAGEEDENPSGSPEAAASGARSVGHPVLTGEGHRLTTSATPSLDESHDRMEIRLHRGRKAYLLIPHPGTLSPNDKDRLKKYIDLVLDEGEEKWIDE